MHRWEYREYGEYRKFWEYREYRDIGNTGKIGNIENTGNTGNIGNIGGTFASMGRFQFLGSSLTNGGVPSPPLWQETNPRNGKLFHRRGSSSVDEIF